MADPVVERNRLSHNHFGLLVADSGRGRFADNTISESTTAAAAFTSGSMVELHGVKIRGGPTATGLLIGEGSTLTATGGEVQGMALAVVVSGRSQVRLTDVRAFHISGDGVIARGPGARLEARRCEVFSVGGAGILVVDGATAEVEGCRLFHNGGAGLAVGPDCTGSAAHNEVFGNGAGQVAVDAPERRFLVS
jgi:parallel beta-helix repeat protein